MAGTHAWVPAEDEALAQDVRAIVLARDTVEEVGALLIFAPQPNAGVAAIESRLRAQRALDPKL